MNVYIKALRAPFLAGSLVPVIIGSSFAILEKQFVLIPFLITVLGVGAIHLGANLLNDYYDARGTDPINVRLTPFSGGSRVIQEKEISPGIVWVMSACFFTIGLACGIWLTISGRVLVLGIGLLGIAAGWSYSSPPLQFMSRGFGEIVIFFAFGPLITFGTHYVMSGHLSWLAFALGIPQGLLITGVIWINQFPDYQADKEVGKKNLVVRLGPNISRYLYCFILLFAFIAIIFLVAFAGISYLIMITFISFPLAVKAMTVLWKEYLSHTGLIPAQALTIQTLIAQGLLLSLGLILSRFIHV